MPTCRSVKEKSIIGNQFQFVRWRLARPTVIRTKSLLLDPMGGGGNPGCFGRFLTPVCTGVTESEYQAVVCDGRKGWWGKLHPTTARLLFVESER